MQTLLIEIIWLVLLVGVASYAVYLNLSLSGILLSLAGTLAVYSIVSSTPFLLKFIFWLLLMAAVFFILFPALRKRILSSKLMYVLRNHLPPTSDTKRIASSLGATWWDTELFSGNPDWRFLRNTPAATLSDEEQAFLDGQVVQLCAMLDDWQVTHNDFDLSPEVWQFIKQQKFFGLRIAKEYGGLEYSAQAYSCVLMKIASRSMTAAITIMAANSLGLTKLLLQHGTQQQRDRYVSDLASGKQISCLPVSGECADLDIDDVSSCGVVCYQEVDGNKTLGIQLSWHQQNVILAPVASLIGMTCALSDPEQILGDEENLGATLVVVPTDAKGVVIGDRHMPINTPYMTGPVQGENVFVPIDYILGEQAGIGQAWRMLQDSFADIEAIVTPALVAATTKFVLRGASAHERVLAKSCQSNKAFTNNNAALAAMGGNAYMLNATRIVTNAALDQEAKSSVVSAIVKYRLTENIKGIVDQAIEVMGNSAIFAGPRNYIAHICGSVVSVASLQSPHFISRNMLVFEQALVRCHPWLYQEMDALAEQDEDGALEKFDKILWSHAGHAASNIARSVFLGLTNSRWHQVAFDTSMLKHYRCLTRLSANFALVADIALTKFVATMEDQEFIAKRLADMLSCIYLSSAVLKYFHERGEPEEEIVFADWAINQCNQEFHLAMQDLLANLPGNVLKKILHLIVYPLGRPRVSVKDDLNEIISDRVLNDLNTRNLLTDNIYIPEDINEPLAILEDALQQVINAAPLEALVNRAKRLGNIKKFDLDMAVSCGVINDSEADIIRNAQLARIRVAEVDDFDAAYWAR